MPVDKKVRVPQSIIDVFMYEIEWTQDEQGNTVAHAPNPITNYAAFKKVVEQLGGHWDKKAKVHVFPTDPRLELGIILDAGGFVVENYGYFDTPAEVVNRMIDHISPRGSILEPSAGVGAICSGLIGWGVRYEDITAIELHEERFTTLAGSFLCGRAIKGDFMTMNPVGLNPIGFFDSVVMNPPFEKGQDIRHVAHAFSFLNSGGRLVSVMSAGVKTNDTLLGREFRELVNIAGYFKDLPADSFKASGTRVNTCLVILEKA